MECGEIMAGMTADGTSTFFFIYVCNVEIINYLPGCTLRMQSARSRRLNAFVC